jgi:hypothetical protein
VSTSAPSRPRIGPYELEVPIGIGATGRVYRAVGPKGAVALKIPRRGEQSAKLLEEARLLRSCAHPHLVRCLDHATDGAWLVTELIDGTPLSQWSRRENPEEIVRMGLELLGALGHLHRLGVVHGDIQPLNILVDDWGHPKLLDLSEASRLSSGPMGTPGFAAPERLAGKPTTPATDVYGLGGALYAALCGHAPFEAGDPAALMAMPQQSSPLPPSTWRVDVPARLDRLLLSMLARDPLRRPDLKEIEDQLCRMHHSSPAQPVVGMARVRRALRTQVALAASGQPTVAVLYGPMGSGRRTLMQDAARQARREGLELIDDLTLPAIRAVCARGKTPVVIARLAHDDTVATARQVLADGKPALLLLYSTQPSPELGKAGAVHLTPEPLDVASVGLIAEWLGAPADLAEELWRAVEGHPRSTWLALEAHATRNTADRKPFSLPRSAARILEAVRARHGVIRLDALAAAVQLPMQALLDYCAMLEACGLVRTERDGRTLRAVDGPGV